MHTITKHFCHVFSNQTDAKSNTNRVSSGTKATEHTWTKTACYQTQIGTIRSKQYSFCDCLDGYVFKWSGVWFVAVSLLAVTGRVR